MGLATTQAASFDYKKFTIEQKAESEKIRKAELATLEEKLRAEFESNKDEPQEVFFTFLTKSENVITPDEFEDLFNTLSAGKQKEMVAQLEYYSVLSKSLTISAGAAPVEKAPKVKKSREEIVKEIKANPATEFKMSEIAKFLGHSTTARVYQIKDRFTVSVNNTVTKENLLKYVENAQLG